MRQPVHQSGLGSAFGVGQVVAPPQPLPAQLWQRANAMPLQHQQQQQQGVGGPAGPLGGGSSSLFGSLQQQQGGGMQQQLPQQLQQHGLGQLHATDSLLAAAAMQQQDHQQSSTSSLLNEYYQQQQQQQRIPNTMGLHAASVSAGSSAQALQSMLGQQQMLLHHQQQQQQQLNLQQPTQGQFQGMGGGSSLLNQQAGSGNMFGLSESSAWQNAGGNRFASLQGLGGNQQQQGMGGNEPYSSMVGMMASGDSPSGMLSNQAYPSLLQQPQSTTPDLMGRLQLQLGHQQQLQLQQQLLQQQQQQQQQQDLQGQARRSSSMSSSSLIGQANNPALWQQQHQQHHSQQHQQQDHPPPTTMPPSMHTYFQSHLNSSVIPSEGDELVKRKAGKKRAKTFPEKLMQAMMDHEDEEAVGWLPDGKSFVIVSPDRFVQDILNNVFKQAKYASFIRKLHRWGFMRLTSGTGTDCFHHPLFQKNRKDLASKITCSTKDKPPAAAMLLGAKGAGGMRGMAFHDAKPPSLAGVEKFIRAKAAAASAVAAATQLPAAAAVGQPEGGALVPKVPPQSQAAAPPPSSLQTAAAAVKQESDEKEDDDIVAGAYVEGDSVEV